MNHLNINQIKEIIPHRHPFLLLDYIEDMCRENMQWDINAYLTEKNSLRDTSRKNL